MAEIPLDGTKWGRVIADAVKYIQSLQVIEDRRVVPQRKPFVARNKQMRVITVSPADRIKQPGSHTGQKDIGYGFNVAYVTGLNDNPDTTVLGEEFDINEKLCDAFELTRGWAPTIGTALLYSELERVDFLPPEAASVGIDVQYFVIRAWVRENL